MSGFRDFYKFFHSHLLGKWGAEGQVVKIVNGVATWADDAGGGGAVANDAAPLATLTCRVTSLSESVAIAVTRCKTSIAGVTTATFTPTVVADGRFRIAWPSGTFPAVSGSPPPQGHAVTAIRILGTTGPVPDMICETGVNLVEVFQYDALAVNSSPPLDTVNCDFLLQLFGN